MLTIVGIADATDRWLGVDLSEAFGVGNGHILLGFNESLQRCFHLPSPIDLIVHVVRQVRDPIVDEHKPDSLVPELWRVFLAYWHLVIPPGSMRT
jgi:hypothetical protein